MSPKSSTPPSRLDAAYKLLFSFPEMVRDLLIGFVPWDWVAELDLSTLERWPDSRVSDDLRQRHQDRVWRVRFRDRWLYMLVLLEFQSVVDRSMALRILAYTALLYQDLLRAGGCSLPPVFPVVLYSGRHPWSAVEDVSDLLTPVGAGLAPFQPSQRYFVLDASHGTGLEPSSPRHENLVAALVRLESGRGPEEVVAALDSHVSVEVVLHPEPSAPLQDPVRLLGRERLPRLHDIAQREPLQRLDQHMDVVGHDDPRQQAVPLAIEVQQCVLHDHGDSVVSKPARAVSLVCVAFDSFAQLRAAGIVGMFPTGELQLGLPPCHDVGGDGVGQTEGDELHGARLVEMGGGSLGCATSCAGGLVAVAPACRWCRCSSGPAARCGRDARAPRGGLDAAPCMRHRDVARHCQPGSLVDKSQR